MRILRGKDYGEMSLLAARIMAAKILSDPSCVLGLATGSTPIGLYDNLVKWNEEGILDFSKVTTVNLDEYKGLTPDNDQSYRYFMNTHLFDRVNIRKDHTFVPDGTEKDEEKACADYNRILEEVGPADIQLLGIGRNGHIGFNEPPFLCNPGGGPEEGLHHGYEDHPERENGPHCRKRQGQGTGRSRCIRRPGHPCVPGIGSAAPQRCCSCGG